MEGQEKKNPKAQVKKKSKYLTDVVESEDHTQGSEKTLFVYWKAKSHCTESVKMFLVFTNPKK